MKTVVVATTLVLGLGLRVWQQGRWWKAQDAMARQVIADEKKRLAETRPLDWMEWTPEVLDEHLAQGRLTVVSVMAYWDPTCVVLERHVVEAPPVRRRLRDLDAVMLRVDCTDMPAEIREYLDEMKVHVPSVIVYPSVPPYKPIVMRSAFTKEWMLDALDRAAESLQD